MHFYLHIVKHKFLNAKLEICNKEFNVKTFIFHFLNLKSYFTIRLKLFIYQ